MKKNPTPRKKKEKSRIDNKEDNFTKISQLRRKIDEKKKKELHNSHTHAFPFSILFPSPRGIIIPRAYVHVSTIHVPSAKSSRKENRHGREISGRERDCRCEKSIWSIRNGVPSPLAPALRPGRLVGACARRGGRRCNVDIALYTGRRDAEWGGRGIGESSTWVK